MEDYIKKEEEYKLQQSTAAKQPAVVIFEK